ncbi:hypothetical protein ANOM_006285 [Aspergillus nomiae NRRL 13137]|uniref:F-box domain-containing protein n=1 Tax=Aspergillus nomiae NRRL (strain ATCC 15546 / NRRL 13137 / CBS 260.88 / M93) TaxID=1509407 RepID=A0A0L1J0Z4_ASPN3|nr:uncharacterized protein ANOM_006285 [Aspergillus nomiae NRRL 13137]KNG85335.1 hypothetical protein ANOM_006285 [Aspergillus nomiae NRRL 13137]
MALLTDLPVEIQHRILSFLHSHHDVAALSLQCRSLHAICDMPMRKKYRRLCIDSKDSSLNQAFSLLMEILKRPTLGRYVRHIECSQGPPCFDDYTERTNSLRNLSDKETQLLRAAICKAGFTGSETGRILNMVMQTEAGEERPWPPYFPTKSRMAYISQALTALLISVSPDLESLATPPPFFNYTGFYWPEESHDFKTVKFPLERLLRQVNSAPNDMPFLQNLRNFYVINNGEDSFGEDRFYVPMDFMGAMHLVHRLPSMEMVGTDILEEDENGAPRVEPRSSNISRIAIRHSALDIFYLANVISSCKVLREFRYSVGGRAISDGSTQSFNPKTFFFTILPHRETLEILDVDVEYYIGEFSPEIVDAEELDELFEQHGGRRDADHVWTGTPSESLWTQSGSLREFCALKQLSIGVNTLMYYAQGVNLAKRQCFNLVDSLPPNLESLLIRGYEKGECDMHDAQIDALVAWISSGSSSLTEVQGITECIPHAEDVGDPDDDEVPLWERTTWFS